MRTEFQAKGLLISSGGTALILALGTVSSIVVSRFLGPAGRGAIALYMVWLWTGAVISSLGLAHSITFAVGRGGHAQELWGRAIIATICQSAIGFPLLWLLVKALVRSDPVTTAVVVAVSFLPGLLLTIYHAALLQGLQCFTALNIARLTQPVLWLASVLLASRLRIAGTLELAFLLGFSHIAAAVVSGTIVWHAVGAPYFRLEGFSALFRYGLRVWIGGISRSANMRLDQLILGAITTTSAVGLYAAAVGMASVLTVISIGVATITLPRTAQLDVTTGVRAGIRSALFAGVAMSVPAAVLALGAGWLVPSLLGPAFRNAVVPFRILLVGQVFLGMNHVLHEVASGVGRPGAAGMIEMAGVIITIVLLAMIVPAYGVIGAAWVSLIAYGLIFAGLLECLRRIRMTTMHRSETPWTQSDD